MILSRIKQDKRIALFTHQGFRWYALSCMAATLGNGLCYISVTWLLLQISNQVSSVALMMICFWLPSVLLGPLFGVYADRYSKKYLIILANLIRALILFIFAYFLSVNQVSLPGILIFHLIIGSMFALYIPTALSFTRELVPDTELLYANSCLDIIYEIGNVVGMGAAGFVIAFTSPSTAILLNAILFLISTISMLFIKRSSIQSKISEIRRGVVTDFVAGIRYLKSNKQLSIIYLIQLLIMVEFMVAPILLAPFAKNVLHASLSEFGQLEASLSIGVILGGIITPFFVLKYGTQKVLLIETGIIILCFYLFSHAKQVITADVIYFILGFSLASWPLILTKAQELTDLNFQGRVQSTFNSLSSFIMLVVYSVIEYLGPHFGIQQFYWFNIILGLIAFFLIIYSRRSIT